MSGSCMDCGSYRERGDGGCSVCRERKLKEDKNFRHNMALKEKGFIDEATWRRNILFLAEHGSPGAKALVSQWPK